MGSQNTRWRRRAVAAIAAVTLLSGVGTSMALAKPLTTKAQRGVDGFGMTKAFYNGKTINFTYNLGYFCDKAVASAASTGCEAASRTSTLRLRSTRRSSSRCRSGSRSRTYAVDCPNLLTCIDHPGTIDLSPVEPALKGLFPTLTDAQLTAALKNYPVPGHDHFIGTLAKSKPQWWEVRVVVVTNPDTYRTIQQKKSLAFVLKLLKEKNKNMVGTVKTNLFLYFAAS